jgi:hypothetical protein
MARGAVRFMYNGAFGSGQGKIIAYWQFRSRRPPCRRICDPRFRSPPAKVREEFADTTCAAIRRVVRRGGPANVERRPVQASRDSPKVPRRVLIDQRASRRGPALSLRSPDRLHRPPERGHRRRGGAGRGRGLKERKGLVPPENFGTAASGGIIWHSIRYTTQSDPDEVIGGQAGEFFALGGTDHTSSPPAQSRQSPTHRQWIFPVRR